MYLFFSVVTTFYVSSFIIVDAQHLKSSECSTLNKITGECISIRQCIPLLERLKEKPLRPETIDYLKSYHCGFDGLDPRVCCPPDINLPNLNQSFVSSSKDPISTLENVDNNDPIIRLLDNPLLPSECGRDSISRDLEAAATTPDEFPWMALLEYKNGINRKIVCTGSLITKRYVLTAAHCFSNKSIGILYVRLGVYDLSSAMNCNEYDDVDICSDGSIRVGIEESIKHELFISFQQDIDYDIGLLRLSRDIVSNDYVKPICLPRTSIVNKRLYVAGWGATLTSTSSNVKLKVSLPLVDKDYCTRLYRFKWNLTLGFEHICAGGEEDRSPCKGDSGGPLMTFQNLPNGDKIWTVVGVVSFGPRYCGIPGWPSVFVNVYDLIPWIISKIRL